MAAQLAEALLGLTSSQGSSDCPYRAQCSDSRKAVACTLATAHTPHAISQDRGS